MSILTSYDTDRSPIIGKYAKKLMRNIESSTNGVLFDNMALDIEVVVTRDGREFSIMAASTYNANGLQLPGGRSPSLYFNSDEIDILFYRDGMVKSDVYVTGSVEDVERDVSVLIGHFLSSRIARRKANASSHKVYLKSLRNNLPMEASYWFDDLDDRLRDFVFGTIIPDLETYMNANKLADADLYRLVNHRTFEFFEDGPILYSNDVSGGKFVIFAKLDKSVIESYERSPEISVNLRELILRCMEYLLMVEAFGRKAPKLVDGFTVNLNVIPTNILLDMFSEQQSLFDSAEHYTQPESDASVLFFDMAHILNHNGVVTTTSFDVGVFDSSPSFEVNCGAVDVRLRAEYCYFYWCWLLVMTGMKQQGRFDVRNGVIFLELKQRHLYFKKGLNDVVSRALVSALDEYK